MTRKTPSRTKRELEKIHRATTDADDGAGEVVVEVGGVPADPPDADDEAADAPDEPDAPRDRDRDVNHAAAFGEFRVEVAPEGAVETTDPTDADTDALPLCVTADCSNPVMPSGGGLPESSVCEKCAGMPRRDWRPVVRENETENGNANANGNADAGDAAGDGDGGTEDRGEGDYA